MSSSPLYFIFVILLIGSANADAFPGVAVIACGLTINAPGQYYLNAATLSYSSQSTPCIKVVDPVSAGNNTVVITALVVGGNYPMITCTNPAGCAPAVKVESTVMKVTMSFFRTTGNFTGVAVYGGNDCTLSQLQFINYNTGSSDVVQCNTGVTTMYYNMFTGGYSLGSCLNAINPSVFTITAPYVSGFGYSDTGTAMTRIINVGGGTGTITGGNAYSTSQLFGDRTCSSPGYTGITVSNVTNVVISGFTFDTNGLYTTTCNTWSGVTVKGIEILNSNGVTVTGHSFTNFAGGYGNNNPTYGIFVTNSNGTTISQNTMFRVQGTVPYGSPQWDNVGPGHIYPIWVEKSSYTYVINNTISNTQGDFAGIYADYPGSVEIHVSSQGGLVANNTVKTNAPGGSGATNNSQPTGKCGDNKAFEIVDSSDITIFQNYVNSYRGCFGYGDQGGDSADGVVSNGGSAYGFYVQNSTGVSISKNDVTGLSGGLVGYATIYPAYGGGAVAYYLSGTFTLVSGNTAKSITAGDNGQSGAGLSPQGDKPRTTEAAVFTGTCDTNMTALELCYPSGSACCPSTCRSRPNTYVCRASAGDCDLTDYCNAGQCVDTKKANGVVCRGMNKTCDIAETCDGVSNSCPVDTFKPAGQACTPACGVAGTCAGSSSLCSTDNFCDQHCAGNSNCRELTDCGFVTQAGFYFVTRDLSYLGGQCFYMQATGITISGENHTIACQAGQSGPMCGPAFNAQQYGMNVYDFNVNGTFGMTAIYCGVNCTLNNVNVINFNIKVAGQDPTSAVYITSGIAKITNSLIDNGNATYGYYLKPVTTVSMSGNIIRNVKTVASGIYILASGSGANCNVTNNKIYSISGPVATQTCCSTSGTDVYGLYITGVSALNVLNNTVRDISPSIPCSCNNAQAAANTRSKGGATGGIYVSLTMTANVNGNTISNIRGSNGFWSGLLSGLWVFDSVFSGTVSFNTITGLYGGNAEALGPTADIVGMWINTNAMVANNTVSQIYGGLLNDTNASTVAPSTQGIIYGMKINGVAQNQINMAYGITVRGNTFTGFVGAPGANVVAPNTATSTRGQSVFGVWSTNAGLAISDNVISNLTSGPAGTSALGSVSTQGSVVGLYVNGLISAYSNDVFMNLTLGANDTSGATVDSSATVPIVQPVQVLNVAACTQQNYAGDEFCYPAGNGCFRTCQVHTCALTIYGWHAEPSSCSESLDWVDLYIDVYDSASFQFGFDYNPTANSANAGNRTVTMTLPGSGNTFVIKFKDAFDCPATLTVPIPQRKRPPVMPAANVTFSNGKMVLSATPLDPIIDNLGFLPITGYNVQYRKSCNLNGGWNSNSWTYVNNLSGNNLTQGVALSVDYDTTYEVQINAVNCVWSTDGTSAMFTSPSDPNGPKITQILPAMGLNTAGDRITIIGTNLPVSGFHVTLDDSQYCGNQAVANGQVMCDVPEGVGANHLIQIVVDGGSSCVPQVSNEFTWSYALPNVTSTSPFSTAGGALTITGTNLGLDNTAQIVTIDEEPCSNCVSSASGTVITCSSCPGGYEDHPLVVVVSDQPSDLFQFSYPKCTPVCMYGTCMANATSTYCQCLPGFQGPSCSEEIVCEAPVKSRCGTCSSGICCFFRSKM